MTKKQLKVTLVRSMFGVGARHRACVIGLGLRRMHHTVTVEDSAATRGMVHRISFMLKCEEVS
ncbi:MAG: 50S ribosomal protein L30 [Acidiferrobacter sp.]